MFFLNLTAGEFLTLLASLGGFIAALYLLDRAKRKKVVSTLRFWLPALGAQEQNSRRRVREPWSLLLQLASLALLLLAIAQLHLGSRERRGRDHVLLLDTSAWTAEKIPGGSLLDREKSIARQYVSTLSPLDRVMLVRVDGLATPATSFTSDHTRILIALNESNSGFSALNIEQALGFARQAQIWSANRQGEIVYIGPELTDEIDTPTRNLPNLRVIPVFADRENCGIRHIGVERSDDDANSWQATVTVKNYGTEPRTIRLRTQFAGTAFAPRSFRLKAGEETGAEYDFTTNTAGELLAQIDPGDALSSDDHAAVELPRSDLLSLAVYTKRPDALRPLLEADHRLLVKFYSPAQYIAKPRADLMLLDEFAPPATPQIASLWINPPRDGSPLPVKTTVEDALITNWHPETGLAAGLHAREARIPAAEVFQTFEGDIPIGGLSEGSVIVARGATESRPKLAAIGFDPLDRKLKFEVTTPLLFADFIRWLSPETFRSWDVAAGRVGAATVTLDPSERADHVHVTDEHGFTLPFTVRDRALQLFASRPCIVRVGTTERERVLSLTLPDIAESAWTPPKNSAAGLPPSSRFLPTAVDIWQFLALLGGLGLFVEWMLFGRRRLWMPRSERNAPAAGRAQSAAERKRELVSR